MPCRTRTDTGQGRSGAARGGRRRQYPAAPAGAALLALAGCGTDAEIACEERACFAEQAAACRPARYATDRAAGARAVYTVEQAAGEHRCRLALRYTDHPDPARIDRRLTFVVDTREPIAGQLESAVAACLLGEPGGHGCGGPLFESRPRSADDHDPLTGGQQ